MSVALAKPYAASSMDELGLAYPVPPVTPPLPWYPLMGHREGLRSNDLITLASAFWLLAHHGGTAHLAPIPGTDMQPLPVGN